MRAARAVWAVWAVMSRDEQKRAVPNDHPVLVAFRNARMVDEPVPEVERVAVEE